MKVCAFLGLLVGIVSTSWALEGRVIDSLGRPVQHATVSILGHSGAAPTDSAGQFSWTPDPKPPFEVLVVLPGGEYMAPVLVEALPEEGPLLIIVEPLITESVTVSSGAAPGIDAPPASALTSVPNENIQERHPTRLTEVIENIPGAGQLSDLHASVPSLRGLARGRTLLLIDGARVTTERRAGPSATFLDPFFLEGVEVSRGPGSVGYGSDAFGGIIHARTRRIDPSAGTRFRLRGALGAGLPEVSGGAEFLHGYGQGGFLLQARYRNFESYRSPEGEVFNSQASDRGFLGRVVHAIGPGQLTAGWQTDLGRDTGRPDDRGAAVRTSYPEEDSHRLTLAYDLAPALGFTRIDLAGFWGSYGLVTQRERATPGESLRAISRSDVVANDFSFRVSAGRPVGRARWEVGADINGRYGLEALESFGVVDEDGESSIDLENTSVENANRIDAALFTSAEALLGSRITAGFGARVDRVTTNNEGGFFGQQSTENTALSGYGSLRLEMARGLSLTGQLSHGFRDPTLSDRYFRGVSGRGTVTGNPNLEPEHANQLDAALRYVRSGLRWSVFGYYYRFTDLIERYEASDERFFFRNRGRADITGIELEMQAEWRSGYALELAAQLSRGETHVDGEPLDDIPVESVILSLRKSFGRGYVRGRARLFARDERAGPTEKVTPGYGVVDLGTGFRFSDRFEIRFRVRNLFDAAYPISPDGRSVLAPGINGVAVFVAEF